MPSFPALPDVAPVGADASTAPAPKEPTASAGFGSPGTDSTVKRIDLNDALIRHPQANVMMRATGAGMRLAGIGDGDILLVDRALGRRHGHVVVAVVDGELSCRRLFTLGGVTKLEVANPDFQDIVLNDGEQLEVWGVVTTVIKSLLT